MAIELVNNKKHLIIKRDGRNEPYNKEKMKKVIQWAVSKMFEVGLYKFKPLNLEDMVSTLTNELLDDIEIKIFDKIKIEKLFDEVIKTASNKANRLQPFWDDIAKNLYIQKIYKETWGMKRDEYPHISKILKKGVQYKVYNKEFVNSFNEDELNELNDYINHKRDFKFTLLGIRNFMKKYSLMHTKNRNLELPQHSIMRLAMFSFYKEQYKKERLSLIKERYDHINYIISEATPRWLNSGKPAAQMASCVLTAMKDDSYSINHTVSNIGLFSKYGGGTACDISHLRCKGSTIANSGVSSGPVPFIKKIESAVTAFNQLGKRPGACAVYFNWWHYDVMDLIILKDEGGTDENRARKLQYGIKLNNIFFDKLFNGEEITLFDPKETPELLETFGEDFNKWYHHYENKVGIKKKKIKATELAYMYAKVRSETGNLYVFFDDNANEGSPYKDEYVNSSNLCVSGNTKIKIKYNKNNNDIIKTIEIQDLEKYIKEYNVFVLSRNTVEEKDEWKKITDFAMTSPKAKVMSLSIEDKNLILTPEHKIWTQNRGYIETKDIKYGDEFLINDKVSKNFTLEYLEEEIEVYDITVEDNHNFYANDILIHNCTEIFLSSKGSKLNKLELYKDISNNKYNINEVIDSGLIALCNLSSINIPKWETLSDEDKENVTYNLLRSHDNLIEYAYYPAKEAELNNKIYRPIGIGVFSLAEYLAKNKTKFSDKKALEMMFSIMEDVYYHLIKASIKLAKERGPFEEFYNSKWVDGWLPIDQNIELFNKFASDYIKDKWNKLRDEVKKGVRFLTLGAIAPTSTSSLIFEGGSTEGINPVKNVVVTKSGTFQEKQFAPELTKYGMYYEEAYDIDNKHLLLLAAIRQLFLDQGQSIDTFYSKDKINASEIIEDVYLASKLKLKSLYYMNSQKAGEKEVCDSCGS